MSELSKALKTLLEYKDSEVPSKSLEESDAKDTDMQKAWLNYTKINENPRDAFPFIAGWMACEALAKADEALTPSPPPAESRGNK